jgi:hypothetical protein
MKYYYRFVDEGGTGYECTFPDVPWHVKNDFVQPGAASEIVFQDQVVLSFSKETSCGEIDRAVTHYFLTLQRKEKLSHI